MNSSDSMLELIRQIDRLTTNLRGATDGVAKNTLDQLIAIIRRSFPSLSSDVDDIFSLERPFAQRTLITAILIRILDAQPALLERRGLSHSVRRLFDNQLKTVYSYARVDQQLQAHERERKLLDLYAQMSLRISRAHTEFKTIQQFVQMKEVFLKNFRSPDATAFIQPLLAKEVHDLSPISDVLNAAIGYAASEAGARFTAYKDFNNVHTASMSALREFSTEASDVFLTPILEHVKNIIDQQFDSDGLLRPTLLSLCALDRKYPLRIANHQFGIGLALSNDGPGLAFDVQIQVRSSLQQEIAAIRIPELRPGSENFSALACTDDDYQTVIVELEVTWNCADSSRHTASIIFELESQREGIEWDAIYADDLYSIEPVTEEANLLGRQGLMKELRTRLTKSKLPSFLLHGQKRVGKTSVVKTLKSILDGSGDEKLIVVYTESGDFRSTDGRGSLEALGATVCKELLFQLANIASYEVPDFDGSLSPLGDLINRLTKIRPGLRFLIIIDEFDELPAELYHRGSIGETLFLNLRALSNKDNVGFILIGSEKMSQIQNLQGEHINKWESRKLDYFSRDLDWNDFVSLVRKPTDNILEITDDAIDTLYLNSAGNPYFTNILCRQMTQIAVRRRDAFVSSEQVLVAVREAADNLPASRFAHFWDDGILEGGDKKELVSVRRRKVLLAIADLIRRNVNNPRKEIASHTIVRTLGETVVRDEVQDLEHRGILNASTGGDFSFKVRLFQEWLVESGIREIITRFQDEDAALAAMRVEDELAIKSAEILAVSSSWIYRGRQVSHESVRAWINQFQTLRNQRLAFRLLEKLRFYSEDQIRVKMKDAFAMFGRRFVDSESQFFTKRPEFFVTHLDLPGKSGSLMAKYFADENRLFDGSIVTSDKLRVKINQRPATRAVVAVDDFVGTGETLKSLISELHKQYADLFSSKKISLFVVAVAGYTSAVKDLRNHFESLGFIGEVIVLDELSSSDACFEKESSIYEDDVERREAEEFLRAQGLRLEKKWPVGYGDCQSAVIFSHNAPNNTLPVLWKQSATWIPLFARN